VGANPRKRPNPEDLIVKLRRSPGFFKNDLIDMLVYLEEIQVKEDMDKNRFFSGLPAQLGNNVGFFLGALFSHTCRLNLDLVEIFKFRFITRILFR
jgi:hypothetical protein